MGAHAHVQGKNTAGSHTTVSDAAKPVLDLLIKSFPNIRITNGVLEANVKARSFSIKITPEVGAYRMVVVANSSKQVFYIYDGPSVEDITAKLRKEKKLRSFFINT